MFSSFLGPENRHLRGLSDGFERPLRRWKWGKLGQLARPVPKLALPAPRMAENRLLRAAAARRRRASARGEVGAFFCVDRGRLFIPAKPAQGDCPGLWSGAFAVLDPGERAKVDPIPAGFECQAVTQGRTNY